MRMLAARLVIGFAMAFGGLAVAATPVSMVVDAGAAPRIVIAGDSTASEYGAERAPRAGWGMALGSFFGANRDVRNHAWSGRSSRSFIEQGGLQRVVADLRRGDVLLIQFGHNDAKREDPARYNEPHDAFPRWLMRHVEAARERGATPILVTPLARRVFDHGQLLDTHGLYAEAVRQLARRERIGLIDLNTVSMDWLRALGDEASKHYFLHVPDKGIADDTHLQWHGAVAVACLIVAEWKRIDPAIVKDVVRDTACGGGAPIASHESATALPDGSRVIRDVGPREQPGPHGGAGMTRSFDYLADLTDPALRFRKRVLPKGAGIGLHPHRHDEVYFVLSGAGVYVLDGKVHDVVSGDVLLTRGGSTHAIMQSGDDDLVLLITYPVVASRD